jgi:transcriptional regulator with XRE-family HTH domain
VDNIGWRLREERQFRGWSQRDLARETGVNTDTISGIETGQHEPRPSTMRKLAEGLGIEVRDLFIEPALPKAPAREAGQPERTEDKPFTSRSRSFVLPAPEPHERDMASEAQRASDLEAVETAAARALSKAENEEELRRVAEAIMTSVSKMVEQAAQEKRERV